VLPYNTQSSLDYISDNADRIAGVFCEAIQNRNPHVHPRKFLQRLRDMTTASNIVLVFDEVVTGFRVGAGGVQAHLGIRADLACYGKAIAGGMVVGAVAGSDECMNGVDGGRWQYGDRTFPKGHRTYFAGTFCKHPLGMAAVNACLDEMIENGDEFYPRLKAYTDYMASVLNPYWKSKGVGISMNHFGSQFRFTVPPDLALTFYQLLKLNGVYTWESRTCFQYTTTTTEDIEAVIAAFKKTTEQLMDAGIRFPPVEETPPKVH